MSNIKAPKPFDIIKTKDGSLTLSLSGGEKMHSTDGAISETSFIYGPVIEKLTLLKNPHILSMGLGLGYNEILTTSMFLASKVSNYTISSFEIVPELIKYFKSWAHEQTNTPLDICYNSALKMIATQFKLQESSIKKRISESLENKSFLILGPATAVNSQSFLYNGILYDAFSNHTDPELWDEDYLDQFINNYCDTHNCYFSTYAATGNLKRILKKNNFTIEKRKGFARKRESTFAYKEL